MNIPPLCFVRFARPAPIIQRGIFWYSVYRHLRLLVSPALLGDLEYFINNITKVIVNLLTDDNVKTYKIGNDTIMVITVPPASREQRPVYINNDIFKGTFRRNWEGDYHCTPSEVRAMLRDQTEQTMDMKVLEDWFIEDLNPETIQSYRNMHRNWKPGHVWGML